MSTFLQSVVQWFWSCSTLSRLAAVDFGIQWGGFVVAALLQTEKFYDLTGLLRFSEDKSKETKTEHSVL